MSFIPPWHHLSKLNVAASPSPLMTSHSRIRPFLKICLFISNLPHKVGFREPPGRHTFHLIYRPRDLKYLLAPPPYIGSGAQKNPDLFPYIEAVGLRKIRTSLAIYKLWELRKFRQLSPPLIHRLWDLGERDAISPYTWVVGFKQILSFPLYIDSRTKKNSDLSPYIEIVQKIRISPAMYKPWDLGKFLQLSPPPIHRLWNLEERGASRHQLDIKVKVFCVGRVCNLTRGSNIFETFAIF